MKKYLNTIIFLIIILTTFSYSQRGYVLSFDGPGQYAKILPEGDGFAHTSLYSQYLLSPNPSTATESERTIDLWVYWRGGETPEQTVFDLGHLIGTEPNIFRFYVSLVLNDMNGNLRVQSSHLTLTTNYEFPQNAWTHVAISYNCSAADPQDYVVRLYVNGSLIASGLAHAMTTANTYFDPFNYNGMYDRFGSAYDGSGAFNGMIDEFRVSRIDRYFGQSTISIPNQYDFYEDEYTIALYKFNEGTGNTSYDENFVYNVELRDGTSWFNLSDMPPQVSLKPVSNLTNNSVRLNAAITQFDNARKAYYRFQFRQENNPDWLNVADVDSITGSGDVFKNLTGLNEQTAYLYRLLVYRPEADTTILADGFTTSVNYILPEIELTEIVNIYNEGATATFTIIPYNSTATYRIEVAIENSNDFAEVASGTVNPSSSVTYHGRNMPGLSPSTFYTVRIIVTNSAGSVTSNLLGFSTYGPPAIVLLTPELGGDHKSVHLKGTVRTNTSNPLQGVTLTYFRALTAEGPWTEVDFPEGIAHRLVPVTVTKKDTGLLFKTTYFYRATAISNYSPDVVYSNIVQATTGLPPAISPIWIGELTTHSAFAGFHININRLFTAYVVERTTDTVNGVWVNFQGDPNPVVTTMNTSRNEWTTLRNLSPLTRYFVRVRAWNVIDTTVSGITEFTTMHIVPLVKTLEPTDVNTTSATIRGMLDPNGGIISGAEFIWGRHPDSLINVVTVPNPEPYTGAGEQILTHNIAFPEYTPVYYKFKIYFAALSDSGVVKAAIPIPSSSLYAWYRADYTPLTAKLPRLRDLSNNNNDAVQTDLDKQPEVEEINYGAGQYRAVKFNGTTDFLSFNSDTLIGKDLTIIIVEARNSDKANNYFLGGSGIGIDSNLIVGYQTNSTIHYTIPGGTNLSGTINPFTIQEPRLTMINNINMKLHYNTKLMVNLPQAIKLLGYPNATLGANPSGNHFYSGSILEVIIYSKQISNQEQRILESYLNNKYSIITPTIEIQAAENIQRFSGTIKGRINTNGAPAKYFFEYGTTSGVYTNSTPERSLLGGHNIINVRENIQNLNSPIYYYRIKVTSGLRTFYSTEISFEPTIYPGVATHVANYIKVHSARINAFISPNEAPGTYQFQWSTDPNLAAYSSSPVTAYPVRNRFLVLHELSGLNHNTTYYYRIMASNDQGTSYGSIWSFKTLTPKSPFVVTTEYSGMGTHSGTILWQRPIHGGSSAASTGEGISMSDMTTVAGVNLDFRVNPHGSPTWVYVRWVPTGYYLLKQQQGLPDNFDRDAKTTNAYYVGDFSGYKTIRAFIPNTLLGTYHPWEGMNGLVDYYFRIYSYNSYGDTVRVNNYNDGYFRVVKLMNNGGNKLVNSILGQPTISYRPLYGSLFKAQEMVNLEKEKMLKAGVDFKPREVLSPMSNELLKMTLKGAIESDGESVVRTYFEYTDFPDLDDNPMTTPERLVYPTSGQVTIEEELENLEPGKTYYYRQILIDGETVLKSRPNSFVPSLEDIDPNPTISAGQQGVFVLGNSGAVVNMIYNLTVGEGTLEATNPEAFYPSAIPLNVSNYDNLRWRILPGEALEEGHSNSGGGFLYSVTFDMSSIPDNEYFEDRTIMYRKDSTQAWVLVDSLPGVSVKKVYPYITVNGLTGFSEFMDATTNQNDPLPVELSSFTARTSNLNVELMWTTVTETSNYGFEIERKFISPLKDTTANTNVKSGWQTIGFIRGMGNSNSMHDYNFTDKRPKPGKYSYRLKQIDTDGMYAYSEEVDAEVGIVPNVFTLSQNYPNPFNPSTTIEFTLPNDGTATLKIFNILGEEVATILNEELSAGVLHSAVFNAAPFASGVYVYQLLFSEKGTENKKQIVKKMMVIK